MRRLLRRLASESALERGKRELGAAEYALGTQDHHNDQDQSVDDKPMLVFESGDCALEILEELWCCGQDDCGDRGPCDASGAAQHDHDHQVHGEDEVESERLEKVSVAVQRARHAGEECAQHECCNLHTGRVDTHGVRGYLIFTDRLEGDSVERDFEITSQSYNE